MALPPTGMTTTLGARLRQHLGQAQHRNTYTLMLNTLSGAAAGVVFWLIMTRLTRLETADVGVGYSIVALGTILGVVAKGGLDTALLRAVPAAQRREGERLLRLATILGTGAALTLTAALAITASTLNWMPQITPLGWFLTAAIAALLVTTWLQDAHFLAEGRVQYSLWRNVVFSAARLLLPILLLLFLAPEPVALIWATALAVSALTARLLRNRVPDHDGRQVPSGAFVRSAARNVSGSAAEFLPGLLLAPLVLALEGAEAAAYFGIAWAAASLLFLASSAVSRSALAEMVTRGEVDDRAIARGARQNLFLVAPAALAGAVLAPWLLSVFGPAYAQEGALVLTILCASILVVAPFYFLLAILRAQERTLPLILVPALMMAALAALAPPMLERFGLEGVAWAWFLANAPAGAYGAWRLHRMSKEVTPIGATPALRRAAYPE